MKFLSTSIPRLDQEQTLFCYNALDCGVTTEVFEATHKQLEEHEAHIYKFEQALMAPVLEMMLRGVAVDDRARADAIAGLENEQSRLDHILDLYGSAILGEPIKASSPKQNAFLFYEVLGFPPIKVYDKQKKEERVSTDREALEKLGEDIRANALCKAILARRDISKKISVLRSGVDTDGRMRFSINIGATTTGRFSSSKGVFGGGMNCVTPETEVLTPFGWTTIEHQPSIIMQYNSGSLEFVEAKYVAGEHHGKIFDVRGEQISFSVTPRHRVLHMESRLERMLTKEAEQVSKLSQCAIPLGGQYKNNATLEYPTFLSMLMADGSKEKSGWRIAFKKQRKIDRFFQLMQEHGIIFNEQSAAPGFRRFYIPGYLEFPKQWGQWILACNNKTLLNLVKEARYWDSKNRGSGFVFYTKDEDQADWFATAVHLCGRSATVRRKEQSKGSWSLTTMHAVNVKDRNHARVQKKHWKSRQYDGLVYCPQVPSSYFLIRHGGKIAVTGNSQNITQKIRRIFIPSKGWKLGEIDLKQADSVGVAFLSGDAAYRSAIASGDLHTSVSRLIWPKLPWTGNIKQDRQIADRPFYREHSYRDFAKNGGHGTNYLGTPRTMAKHLKVEVRVMEEFQPLYFQAFPGIRNWQTRTIKEVQTKGYLITPFGRKRRFLGRSWDNSTLREAIAYVPQSLTADYINLGLLRIWMFKGADIRLLLQVHDSLLFEYPENKPELIEEAMALISKPLECGFKCDSEASVGWNWMKVEKSEGQIVGNEWGLASFPDLRNNVATKEELDRRIS